MGADLYMNPPPPECRTRGCTNHPTRCEACLVDGTLLREKVAEIEKLKEQIKTMNAKSFMQDETIKSCRRIISAWKMQDEQ